jgi:hypothetical protein
VGTLGTTFTFTIVEIVGTGVPCRLVGTVGMIACGGNFVTDYTVGPVRKIRTGATVGTEEL